MMEGRNSSFLMLKEMFNAIFDALKRHDFGLKDEDPLL
jgi:hypothetical protein